MGWEQGTLCPGLAGISEPVAGGRGGVSRWEVVGGSAHVGTSLRVHGAGVLDVCLWAQVELHVPPCFLRERQAWNLRGQ